MTMYSADVDYRTRSEEPLIRAMIKEHNGKPVVSGFYIVAAEFNNGVSAQFFEKELGAYNEQQEFLETLNDETAAELRLVL